MARFDLSIAFNDFEPRAVARFYEVRLQAAEAKIRSQEQELQELRSRLNVGNPRFVGAQLPKFG